MCLVAEKLSASQSQEEPSIMEEDSRPDQNKDLYSDRRHVQEVIIDNNYIRIPGDPYPYSREHFYKWHMHKRVGSTGKQQLNDPNIINSPINSSKPLRIDSQQPARKMSCYYGPREGVDGYDVE